MKAPIDNFIFKSYPEGCVTQWFGENPALYKPFGLAFHNGIDIVAPHGSPIYSVCDGTVYAVRRDETGYGRHIRIKGKAVNEIANVWVYGHLDTILVNKGDKVKAGQKIATMGNTGFVVSGATPYWEHNPYAGTHLHIGVRRYWGDTVLDYDNGVKGGLDPKPFLEGLSNEEAQMQKQLTLIALLRKLVAALTELKSLKK